MRARLFKLFIVALAGILLTCLSAWWFLVYPSNVTPVPPLPNGATSVDHKSYSATQAYWYVDKYQIDDSPQDVMSFYENASKRCYYDDNRALYIRVANYQLTCTGRAKPIGGYEVQIGQADDGVGTIIVVEVRWFAGL